MQTLHEKVIEQLEEQLRDDGYMDVGYMGGGYMKGEMEGEMERRLDTLAHWLACKASKLHYAKQQDKMEPGV